jgi:two-component system, NtrC family, sensor histidine kinase HydH
VAFITHAIADEKAYNAVTSGSVVAFSAGGVWKAVVTNRRVAAAVLIGCLIPVITYLDRSTSGNQPLHSIYAELYQIPLLLAALLFGLRGAGLTCLAVTLLYAAHEIGGWHGASMGLLDDSIHVAFPVILALLIGFLVDLRTRIRGQLEQHRYLSGLGQAAAVLVHDLKNPLLSIRADIRRFEKGTISSEEAVTTVRGALEKMEQIMNAALDFSKPLQLDRRESDAASLLRTMLQSSMAKAEHEGVELVIDIRERPLTVMVDHGYLERAVANLVNNAIEASQTGQSVLIRLLKKNDAAIIRIRDYGKGMDKEVLRHLFIPFYSKKNSGTGLGMAVARKIVEEHGGRITVSSRPAAGTKVALYLPLTNPSSQTRGG